MEKNFIIVKIKKVIIGYNLRFLNILNLVHKNLKLCGKCLFFECECGSYLLIGEKKL